jgi:hypothetical protein
MIVVHEITFKCCCDCYDIFSTFNKEGFTITELMLFQFLDRKYQKVFFSKVRTISLDLEQSYLRSDCMADLHPSGVSCLNLWVAAPKKRAAPPKTSPASPT